MEEIISDISMRIAGEGISPETLDVDILFSILASMKAAIISQMKHSCDLEADERMKLCLSRLRHGSVVAALRTDSKHEEAKTAYSALCHSIKTKKAENLDIDARDALKEVQKICKKNAIRVELKPEPKRKGTWAMITPSEDSVPAEPPCIKGQTSIYGEVIRAGGVEPSVLLSLDDTNRVACKASREIVKALSSRLYEWVGVSGTATWDPKTFQLRRFRIESVLPYREDTNMAEALQRIRELSHGAFDGVDAVQFVKDLRGD